MLGLLRVLLFEWILARIAMRWVVGGLLLAGGALVFFVGIPLFVHSVAVGVRSGRADVVSLFIRPGDMCCCGGRTTARFKSWGAKMLTKVNLHMNT